MDNYTPVPDKITQDPNITPTELRVWINLYSLWRWNKYKGQDTFPSINTIADRSCISRVRAQVVLRSLADKGYVKITERRRQDSKGKKQKTTNRYDVLLEVKAVKTGGVGIENDTYIHIENDMRVGIENDTTVNKSNSVSKSNIKQYTPEIEKTLEILLTIPGVNPTNLKNTGNRIVELITEFPATDPVEIARCMRDWHEGKSKECKNPSLAIRNWFKRDQEYKSCQRPKVKPNDLKQFLEPGYKRGV